ncbi:UNVERIFIED_ORG: hypothetical protein GGD59_003267 [Rhizobium esperanzae]
MRESFLRASTAIVMMYCATASNAQEIASGSGKGAISVAERVTGAVPYLQGWISTAAPLPSGDARGAAENDKDYSIQTNSISNDPLQNGISGAGNESEEIPVCMQIPAPPAALKTQSKYNEDDGSKSSIDEDRSAEREKLVQPIRNSIRLITNIAYASSDNPQVAKARAECVLQNVDRWASSQSLTEMRSSDAYLSRDRWVAEIALAVQAATRVVNLSETRRSTYGVWFGKLARDTMEAYTLRLGPKSKTNNHRYWAGLSVAAIGFLVDEPEFKSWGKTSFEIGACQVDENGILPAELARGNRALDYHIYALRPLAAIAKIAAEHGEPLHSKCFDGFKRLASMTHEALENPDQFEKIAGLRQAPSSQESSYSAALKLDALSIF